MVLGLVQEAETRVKGPLYEKWDLVLLRIDELAGLLCQRHIRLEN
jgi:hypothetical protein